MRDLRLYLQRLLVLGIATFGSFTIGFLPGTAWAAACASGGNLGAGLVVQVDGVTPNPVLGVVAHIGDTLTVSDVSVNIGATSCNASNGRTWVVYPDNHSEMAMLNFNLPSGQQIFCDSTTHPNDTSCQTITTSWLIKASDLTPRTIIITTNIPQAPGFTFTCSATTTDPNHM